MLAPKKAGSLLASQIVADNVAAQRKSLRAAMQSVSKERKKQIRKTRQLKAKAKSTKMDELMQILVMKASLWSQEDEEKKSGGSSGSKDAWTPSSPKSAFEKIEELMRAADKDSVGRFAEALKAKSKSVQEDDA